MKKKDKLDKPTSAGRVAGKGLSTKWGSYYTAGVRKDKKTSSESQTREVEALKAQVARIPELVQEQVEQQLGTKLNAMVPTLIHGLTTWIAGGQQGPPPVPSFTASNSHSAQARHWCLRRRRHWCLRRRRYSCLRRRHGHWSLMHPGVRRPAPRQQAPPPSVARPPLAVPRH